MPPSRKHHNRIRDLVLQSAGRLFNRHGFNAVSIDDVMAEARLTRGSFYCYFASKSDLYAQSVARVVHEDRENSKGSGSERALADKIVHDYLSEAEQDSTADTFPMIGLPNDISRTDRAVRQAFEAALKLMIQSFEQLRMAMPRRGARMHSPSLRFVSAAWFCRARSMTASWVMSCGVPPKRPRSTLASGELVNGEHVRYCGQADSQRASIFSCESTIGMPAIAALLCTVAV
jgi:TetR/AcrR family transcriptional repressor of nem operon